VRWSNGDVLSARAVPFGRDQLWSGMALVRPPRDGELVWYIDLGVSGGPTGGMGTEVYIDYYDGHVIAQQDWVS
jgi:hypothetical protein